MIVEYVRYRVQPGEGERLIQAYERAAESLRRSAHCLGFELSRCVEEPEQFVLRITWDSAEGHMTGFRKGPEFAAFFAAVQPFVKAIEEMRHYALTEVRFERSGRVAEPGA
ncbi:MAG: antibiotic biosynthesis monooxygenase family protein [Myxococcales bacterium]